MSITIQSIGAAQTHALRGAVLRPGAPPAQLVFPGDDAPQTRHFGAFFEAKIVGIASVYPEKWALDAELDAWRLRGMAVAPDFSRRGIGGDLVRVCLAHCRAQNGEVLWCNARRGARAFYLALGFESVGEEFEIDGIGPHFLMKIRL